MSVRAAILRHLRVHVQPRTLDSSKWLSSTLCRSGRSLCELSDDLLDRQEIAERVLSVIKKFKGVDPSKVTPDAHFIEDLGLDSLDNVEIVMELENEFKLEIPDEEADKLMSCDVAIDYLYKRWLEGN